MPLTSLLYVSTSTLPEDTADMEIEKIIDSAQRNNEALNLTGALLYTGNHFAQVLEGSAADIDELLYTVLQDPRHGDIVVVDRSLIDARRFRDWRMAYSGPSRFVSRFVSRVLEAPPGVEHQRAAGWLTDLMQEFNSTRFA